MLERSKHPAAFIDAEGLASHISIYSETNMAQAKSKEAKNNSNTNSSKSGHGKTSKNIKSSNTNLNQSQTSDRESDKSTSQTQTNPISSETVTGAYGVIKKKAEYVDEQLPESIMKAIRIIERLLTQSEYHEQHVLYKNYPPVKLGNRNFADEEEDEESKKKNVMAKM